MSASRRKFLQTSTLGVAALGFGCTAKSYARILGSNDRINFGVAGLNSRGKALAGSIKDTGNTAITAVCDVDSRVVEASKSMVMEAMDIKATGYKDFRKMVESKDIDAVAIATPDHWHAPMAIIAASAGKHVYLEKPCCHNPREGELVIEAGKKYERVIQMGNQQRSAPTSQSAIQDIRDGMIGETYFGKAWYSNNRKSIGKGNKSAVPEWLDWDLFQGPAPREEYRDNIVHYNWHWFWNWGTGEINNNGTHELDICRWALGVEIPKRASSSGGRMHFDDDWEFYDTQIANFEFENGKMITWEGRSCNGHQHFNRGRGVTIHGTKGTVLMDRGGYEIFDNDGNSLKKKTEKEINDGLNLVGGGNMTTLHMTNFCNGIRISEKLNAPIDEGYVSNLMPHLGNIAQELGRALEINTQNGHVIGDEKAMSMWSRSYEPGWEPVV